MAYPFTETGYNMFDMLSMIQKSIRRGEFELAGFAANQLRQSYRKTMWNRLLVITAEDCFGVITKEIIKLKEKDEQEPDGKNISNAVALMCRAKKSRDACYFACNFVLVSRRPENLEVRDEDVRELNKRIPKKIASKQEYSEKEYDMFGFQQMSLFDSMEDPDEVKETELNPNGEILQEAIVSMDMDAIGYAMDLMRNEARDYMWDVIVDFAKMEAGQILNEILALREADDIVNQKKKDKDEIFASKAVILLCQYLDESFETMNSCNMIESERCIDWEKINVKPIGECTLKNNKIPDWVYDCHTLKGKRMGKTDWDMTTTEQAALFPLQKGYFDEGSWIYAYEQDYVEGLITHRQMEVIRKYAETHKANPVGKM